MGRSARTISLARVGAGTVLAAQALLAAFGCSSFGGAGATPDARDGAADAPVDPTALPPGAPDGSLLADADCSWFCDDFDHDPWPGSGWSDAVLYQDGGIGLVTTNSQSSPRSLEAVLPAGSGPTSGANYPNTRFAAASAIHCEVSVYVQSKGDNAASFLALELRTESQTHTLQLVESRLKGRLELYEDDGIDYDLPELPSKEWVRVGIDYRLGTATRVTFNGGLVNHPAISPAADAGAAPITTEKIALGLGQSSPDLEWRFDYDDVACSLVP